MSSQPIHKVIFLGRKFFLPNLSVWRIKYWTKKKLTRTEGDKNIGRIRPGFILTEKSLTLHSKPDIQYEQNSKPWYKNPEPNSATTWKPARRREESTGGPETHVQRRKTRGACFATFDHSYSQARTQCNCMVLGSRSTTTNLGYTDTIYQIGR